MRINLFSLAGALLLPLLILGAGPAQATPFFIFGDEVNGAVRKVTDPVGTNLFDQSSASIGNGIEFSGIDGDFAITADVTSADFINVGVDRIPLSPNAAAPNYRFTFSDIDFQTPRIVTGLSNFFGTPGIEIFDVETGADFVAFTLGTTFLSNGGSFGRSIRFESGPVPDVAAAIPEPRSLALFALALTILAFLTARFRREGSSA